MSTADIAAALASGDPSQRQAAYAQLESLAAHGGDCTTEQVALAVDSVRTLLETVLSADKSVVGADEFQQAATVLVNLYFVDSFQVCAEYYRDFNTLIAWEAPGSVLAAVFEKSPDQLTRSDAMITALSSAPLMQIHSRGMEKVMVAAAWENPGSELFEFCLRMGPIMAGREQTGLECPSADFLLRLGLLSLEILREPNGASGFALSGAYWIIISSMSGRPEIAMALINAGLLDVALGCLQESSPTSWVCYRTPDEVLAGSIFLLGWSFHTLQLPVNKTELLLDTGFIDAAIKALQAFEIRGSRLLDEANTCTVWACTELLSQLDLTATEAKPIVRRLEKNPSTLCFLLDNDVVHFKFIGNTSATHAALVCALAFGKEEAESCDFQFTQETIDSAVSKQLGLFSGMTSHFFPILPPFYMKSIRYLCISDSNKKFLLRSESLLPLLFECLLIDPTHARQKLPEAIKTAIQQDATDCFLQLALYEPGREMLRAKGAEVLEALREVAKHSGRAWSEEAVRSAHGALVAIEGRHEPESAPQTEGGGGHMHIMMSYQWNVQVAITRIVRALQQRGYDIWFDLDRLKGSTVDAMGEAVDNAELLLYGVSKAYKESANCRLEAAYAHQQQKEMIPLMMERDYIATGWLGLILGTRLWYLFCDCEHEPTPAFENRLDAVIREIGDRCKNAVAKPVTPAQKPSEGVPPATAPAASTLQPVPATPSHEEGTTATPTRHDQSFTPTMNLRTVSSVGQQVVGTERAVGTLAEMSAIFQEIQHGVREHEAKLRQELRGEHASDIAVTLPSAKPPVTEEQLACLQARIEVLQAAKLVSDDETFALEDVIGDYVELNATAGGQITLAFAQSSDVGRKMLGLIGLSESFVADGSFARQARRKYAT